MGELYPGRLLCEPLRDGGKRKIWAWYWEVFGGIWGYLNWKMVFGAVLSFLGTSRRIILLETYSADSSSAYE